MTPLPFRPIRMRAVPGLIMGFSVLLSGCVREIPPPNVHENPQPREHYRMTLRIGNDAPGPFDEVSALVSYRATNPNCAPLTPISGVRMTPEKDLRPPLTKVDEHTYRAEFYLDRLIDEDYYGEGVCHWELMSANFSTALKRNYFTVSRVYSEIRKGHLDVTHYFPDYWYFNPSPTPFGVVGEENRQQYKEPDKTFSLSLHLERLP